MQVSHTMMTTTYYNSEEMRLIRILTVIPDWEGSACAADATKYSRDLQKNAAGKKRVFIARSPRPCCDGVNVDNRSCLLLIGRG